MRLHHRPQVYVRHVYETCQNMLEHEIVLMISRKYRYIKHNDFGGVFFLHIGDTISSKKLQICVTYNHYIQASLLYSINDWRIPFIKVHDCHLLRPSDSRNRFAWYLGGRRRVRFQVIVIQLESELITMKGSCNTLFCKLTKKIISVFFSFLGSLLLPLSTYLFTCCLQFHILAQ